MAEKRYKILYEDDWIMVIDKPAGMLVIPTPKGETNTLTALLNRELDERAVEVNAYPCHRLDRETSGLILYAKGKKIQQVMMEEFKNRRVEKRYIAFVHGTIKNHSGTIKRPIYNRSKERLEDAVTMYRVLQRCGAFSAVEARPITGRTNQIRIHFKDMGHPLVGESVYAFRKDFALKFKRIALHAKEVGFAHPFTKKWMAFTAPLPEDMKGMIERPIPKAVNALAERKEDAAQ